MALDLSFERLRYQPADLRLFLIKTIVLCYFWQQQKRCGNMALAACLHIILQLPIHFIIQLCLTMQYLAAVSTIFPEKMT